MPAITRLLTNSEVGEIEGALRAARAGRATLPQLAHAHSLAETQGLRLSTTIGELRGHMRSLIPYAPFVPSAVKQVMLGIASGILTWAILGRKDENAS